MHADIREWEYIKMSQLLWLLSYIAITSASQQCRDAAYSQRGNYLKGHVISSGSAAHIGDCLVKCSDEPRCKSINFRFKDLFCELNGADRYTHPEDYGSASMWHAYSDYPQDDQGPYHSCAEIKAADNWATSGHYWVKLRDRMMRAYCDMDKFGGGWTLVVSINSNNKHHLIRGENNCFNETCCVPYDGRNDFPGRKMKDEDIHWLASSEGTFRVEVLKPSSNFSVFYKVPSGAKHFDSGCATQCPRIVISYSYPYKWEADCNGVEKGYALSGSCHRVFDGYSRSAACGPSSWISSQFGTKRVLYGYCGMHTTGIYNRQQGRLYVN